MYAEVAISLNRFGPLCRQEGEEDTPLSMQDIRVRFLQMRMNHNVMHLDKICFPFVLLMVAVTVECAHAGTHQDPADPTVRKGQ